MNDKEVKKEGTNGKSFINLILGIIILLLSIFVSYSVGFKASNKIVDNNKINNSEDDDRLICSNISNIENTNSSNYTIKDIIGTFESKEVNDTISFASDGIYSQDFTGTGCGGYYGNYMMNDNIITMYPIVQYSCDFSGNKIIKNKTLNVQIISKDELKIDNYVYKRINSKEYNDNDSGLRYSIKNAFNTSNTEK